MSATTLIRPPARRLYAGCHFADIYADPRLDAEDRAAVTDLLLDTSIPHTDVADALTTLGVTEKMVERHRRSKCFCGRF
jgi:hypothetical protein